MRHCRVTCFVQRPPHLPRGGRAPLGLTISRARVIASPVRTRYIFHGDLPCHVCGKKTGGLVPDSADDPRTYPVYCFTHSPTREIDLAARIRTLTFQRNEPYYSPQLGMVVKSRRELQAHLRREGLEEVSAKEIARAGPPSPKGPSEIPEPVFEDAWKRYVGRDDVTGAEVMDAFEGRG